MPKYMFKSHLTVKGVAGTMKDGGTGRKQAVAGMFEGLGGKLESFYYAFGATDAFAIGELPDNAAAVAAAAAVGLSGTSSVETIVLIDPTEIDAAAQMTVGYRPPGAADSDSTIE